MDEASKVRSETGSSVPVGFQSAGNLREEDEAAAEEEEKFKVIAKAAYKPNKVIMSEETTVLTQNGSWL